MRTNGHNQGVAPWLRAAALLLLGLALLTPAAASAAPASHGGTPEAAPGATPAALTDDELLNMVAFDQNLNAQMPVDAPLRDEQGRTVSLGKYLGVKPAILVFTYYHCPNLCPVILHGLAESLGTMRMDVGGQYDVIVVSIDPRETPEDATGAKAGTVARYGRWGTQGGWHFLTGEEASIQKLADAAGFHYAYDVKTNEYAHPSGILVLTPEGKISKYFYGLEYSPTDLKLGLVDASAGKIGTVVDQILLRCFHYDPNQGRYTPAIMNLVKAGGILTVAALAGTVVVLSRRKPANPGDDGERTS
jgi:protein SCO1